MKQQNPDLPVDELTILLLGQTGCGKSSLLNLLHNFEAVVQNGIEALKGEVKDFVDPRFERNSNDRTVSQTAAATAYPVTLGPLHLRIVDTPGFGDTRGLEVDKEHATKIVNCIKRLGALHAIALVISGREVRMTAQLNYVLGEICAILPKTARDNIFVIFTNTPSPLYLNFEIKALSELVEHQVEKERQIFIENPYALWENHKKNKGNVNDQLAMNSLADAFKNAVDNVSKFLSEIAHMQRLNTHDFEALYDLRQKIESTTLELVTDLETVRSMEKQLEA